MSYSEIVRTLERALRGKRGRPYSMGCSGTCICAEIWCHPHNPIFDWLSARDNVSNCLHQEEEWLV